MFKKALRWNLTDKLYTLEILAETADRKLFRSLCKNSSHCLSVILPPQRPVSVISRLRKRGHVYELPHKSSNLQRKSFLVRNLFNNM